MADDTNGFNEYRRLILTELERLNARADATDARIETVRIEVITGFKDTSSEIASLKAKASMWGGIAGIVFAGLVSYLFHLLT